MAFANLRLRDSLREMSIRDSLTGLFNRRYMEETLTRELNLATRNETEVGMIIMDIDHFKVFNDEFGHEAGDEVLAGVAAALTRYSRVSDVACRFGGEEFMWILPNCSLENARLRAEELRHRVSALLISHRGLQLPGPTISCGVAAFPQHATTGDGLIHIADAALYAAKNGGRDRVVVAPLIG
jgi:diguanylate cyclase (GGDEF)-like protein